MNSLFLDSKEAASMSQQIQELQFTACANLFKLGTMCYVATGS